MKISTRDLVLVALFAGLTAVGAFIRIPIPYVPFTLQYLFCAFAGIFLGAKLGALSQIIYVLVGLVGVPIFTEGGGPSYVLQPTFGYLIGFIVAAYVIGKVLEKIDKVTFFKAIRATLCGLFFVYFFGVLHLYIIQNIYATEASKQTLWFAVFYGFIICVAGDLFISVIVSITATKAVPVLRKTGLIRIES